MVWDRNEGVTTLTRDEQVVLDHVTGLSSYLPAPDGQPCKDRDYVGELMAMRAKVGSVAITSPRMKLSFNDVLQAAQCRTEPEQSPNPSKDARIFYWLTTRWGIGLVTAASVAVAFMTGAIVTGGSLDAPGIVFNGPHQVEQSLISRGQLEIRDKTAPDSVAVPPTVETPPVYALRPLDTTDPIVPAVPNLVRSGSIHLRHTDPAIIQQRVTDLVTSRGGAVTNLTRSGSGLDTNVQLEIAVPAADWSVILAAVSALGEVLAQAEAADEVTGRKIDLKARLSEAQDYLKRLDALAEKPSTLPETQNLERDRRETRREIETLKAALESLENCISLSRLTVKISAQAPASPVEKKGEFAKAWDDGVEGLEKVSAFGMKAGIAGSPLLLGGALIYLALRRKRRRELAASK